MSLKLLWKPLLVLGVGVGTTYGTQQWKRQETMSKLHINDSSTDKELIAIFDRIDSDASGHISRAELRGAFQRAGLDLTPLQIEAMVFSADNNSDGEISKEEWLQLWRKVRTADLLKNNKPAAAGK